MPPSTNRMTPLMPLAMGDARKTMPLAISSASRNSFLPYAGRDGNQKGGVHLGIGHVLGHGVVVLPGATELMRSPSTAQDGDTRRTHRARACLDEL